MSSRYSPASSFEVRGMRRTLQVLLVLAAAGACGGSPAAPTKATLTERIASAHFVFHFSAGDRVDVDYEEAFHVWATAQLGVTPGTIQYNKYTGREQMGAITGNGNTNAYAETGTSTIHTIWPSDN